MKLFSRAGVIAAVFLSMVPMAHAGDLDDATIYAIFDQANTADIATARLGTVKGHAAEVRALAEMVRNDHLAVQRMGRDLAQKLGLPATPPANDQSYANLAQAYNDLQSQSGKAFDEAYLRYEIGFHTAVINAVNTVLLPAIQDPELKDLVVKVLPGFEHHLAETKRVAAEMDLSF